MLFTFYLAFNCCRILKCLTVALNILQREDLQKVMDLLSVKEHHARTILIHYRWNVEKVLMVFVDKGNELYAEAGITLKEHDGESLFQISSKVTCNICIEEVLAIETTTMDCGHCYCNNCKCIVAFGFLTVSFKFICWRIVVHIILNFQC